MSHYFDQTATGDLDRELLDCYMQALCDFPANPATHYASGQRARAALEEAKLRISRALHCLPGEVIFTSSATESINTVIKSVAWQSKTRAGVLLAPAAEHAATRESLEFAAKELGRRVAYLPLRDKNLDLEAWQTYLDQEKVDLVSSVYVHNLTGAIYPVQDLAALVRKKAPQARIHIDAVQALGKCEINFAAMDVDYLSLSLHKLGCPKGSGLLLANQKKRFVPLLHGGGQEEGRRSSTENPALALTSALAIEKAVAGQAESLTMVTELRQTFLAALHDQIDAKFTYQVLAPEVNFVPHIVPLYLPGLRAQNIQTVLSEAGWEVGIGSACSSTKQKAPQALLDLGLNAEESLHFLRISLSPSHSSEEVVELAGRVAGAVKEFGLA
ncbi:MAG: aminotransferase class V-fold PLP-dependent enzyme [Eubacteriales bacterium]|nr:aminotransferase class V-fold PLP-dependent enzyme [Eubacteriales bacterium]